MILLLQMLIISMVILVPSMISVYGLGRRRQLGWGKICLLIFGPIADALLVFVLLNWLQLSTTNQWVGALSIALLSHVLIQPMLVPQRLVVWRLASQNVLRRKRQAALLLAGLVIASAIITSSLVVGDSLDETVRWEVEVAYDETDIVISGYDPYTGAKVEFSQQLAEEIWQEISTTESLKDDVTGRQYGYSTSVSVSSQNGNSNANIAWFARNASVDSELIWSDIGDNGLRFSHLYEQNINFNETQTSGQESIAYIAVDTVFADELEVVVGDIVEVDWFVNEDDGRVRKEGTFQIIEIVKNVGQGARGGTRTATMFTDLATSQILHSLDDKINNVAFSLDDSLTSRKQIDPTLEQLEEIINRHIKSSDVGLELTVEDTSGALTISSTAGLGRVSGEDVSALRENLTILAPDSVMMEVLQVPLIDVQFNDEQLITLSDSTVTNLFKGNRGLWHVSASGVGFQIEGAGDAWIWRAPDEGLLGDFALSGDGIQGLISHDSDLYLASEKDLDSEYIESFSSENMILSISTSYQSNISDEYQWLAISEGNDSIAIQSFDSELQPLAPAVDVITTSGRIISSDFVIDEQGIHILVSGLLSDDYYWAENIFTNGSFTGTLLLQQQSSNFPSQNISQIDGLIPEYCDATTSIEFDINQYWCSYENGLIKYNENQQIESIRLPLLSDSPGIGAMPQMFLAFGGENTTLSVDDGSVLLSTRMSGLESLNNESQFWVKGVLPYAFGNSSATRLLYGGEYSSVQGFDALEQLDSIVLGLISLNDAEELALADDDERSILLLSGGSLSPNSTTDQQVITAIQQWFDEKSTMEDSNLVLSPVKLQSAEAAAESSGVMAAMFLVFGSFTIAAGILLVLTIIMMLSESRREELGTIRALGLRKADARALAVQEGVLVASIAGLLGSILGLFLAWMISVGFSNIFSSVGAGLFRFSWSIDSVISGWSWGFLIAMTTLWLTAIWSSNLNIVQALRGTAKIDSEGVPWTLLLTQIITIGGFAICTIGLWVFGFDNGMSYLLWVGAGICLTIAITPVFTWQLAIKLKNKSSIISNLARHRGRNTLGFTGVLLLVWTLILAPIDPIRAMTTPNEFAFITLGLVEVFAGVLVLTSLAPLAVQRIGRAKILTKRLGPVIPVALAHPLSTPMRTAVVMGMFSITVFSVIVLGGYAEQFENYSGDFVYEAEGEFEILLMAPTSRPLQLEENHSQWNLNATDPSMIDATGGVYRSIIFMEDSDGESMPYILRGFDEGFSQHGGLPLHIWDESLGPTEKEAWNSIGNRNDIVFIDASFGLESASQETAIVPLSFSIGDSILLIESSNPANTRIVQVGGFLEQSSYLFSAGIWMNDEIVEQQFSGKLERLYVSVPDNAKPSEDFDTSNLKSFSATGKPSDARFAAAEVAEHLEQDLSGEGVTVLILADEVLLIQSLVLAILAIFEGYLALGLIVGIAGIGVVTVRSVSERKRTIGVLRALGYRSRMVTISFLIEVSWVSVLGMLNGVIVAIGFHRALYVAFWQSQGAEFTLPWNSILMVFFGGWLLVLIVTAVPVSKAAKISPSAALRDY
jgi:putative ABC transport system permease protein